MITFTSNSGLYSITLKLEKRDGLYYCPTDVLTVAKDPICPDIPKIHLMGAPPQPPVPRHNKGYVPVTRDQLEENLEMWMLRLSSPGEYQLNALPGNVTGIPSSFQYHPF
jgi:hypothetical protein